MVPILRIIDIFFNPLIWSSALILGIAVALIEWRRTKNLTWLPILDFNKFANAVHASEDGLTSGGTSGFYFDLDRLSTTVDDIDLLSSWYIGAISGFVSNNQVDFLAFMEKDSGPVGAITLLGQIVLKTNIPAVVVRLRKRMSGAKVTGKFMITGLYGRKVLLITDVLTTGRIAHDAISAIRGDGGVVVGICTLLDRREKTDETLDGSIPVLAGTTTSILQEKHLILAD